MSTSKDRPADTRLNKFMSQAGVASRREADRMISAGRVSVNDRLVLELGTKIDPRHDRVQVDGKNIRKPSGFIYLMINKPAGYIVTMKDPLGRPTVRSLIPKVQGRVYPVGRLDFYSEGLILMTNDGELAHRLAHPRFGVLKTYIVKVTGRPEPECLRRMEQGIVLDGRKTSPAKTAVLERRQDHSILRVEIHEGWKREVRRMCEAIGHPVMELRRTEYAGLSLKHLKPGSWRLLTDAEVARLKQLVKLD